MTQDGRQATPEALAARYTGRWAIYRELRQDDTHGDWVASPCRPTKDNLFRARSIERLADQLQRAAGS
jgi:hypothetical protein